MKIPFRVSFDVLTNDNKPGEILLDVDPVSGTIRLDLLEEEEPGGPSISLSMEAVEQLAELLKTCAQQRDTTIPEYQYTVSNLDGSFEASNFAPPDWTDPHGGGLK